MGAAPAGLSWLPARPGPLCAQPVPTAPHAPTLSPVRGCHWRFLEVLGLRPTSFPGRCFWALGWFWALQDMAHHPDIHLPHVSSTPPPAVANKSFCRNCKVSHGGQGHSQLRITGMPPRLVNTETQARSVQMFKVTQPRRAELGLQLQGPLPCPPLRAPERATRCSFQGPLIHFEGCLVHVSTA